MNHRLSFVFLAVLLLLVVFDRTNFKNYLMGKIANWLGNSKSAELDILREENKILSVQVLELKNNINLPKADVLIGKVFSSYPFNNKNLLSINVGREQGLKESMPVTLYGHVLIGKVDKVFKNYSLVKTIFSPDWEIPVRIGEKKIPALLVGGPDLNLTMIINDKPIFEGQPIFAADQDLPYGLLIGEVLSVSNDSATGVFKEAAVKLDYNFNELTELSILLWTPD